MASKYSSYLKAWVETGPKHIIKESEFGFNHSSIYFPGVKSCVAVIAKLQLGLCGAHLTIAEDDAAMDAILEKMAARSGGHAGSIVMIGALPLLGQGCAVGSGFKHPAMIATLKQRLAGGGATVCGLSLPAAPGCDVRADVSGNAIKIFTRPVVLPFSPADGWEEQAPAAI